MNLVLSKKPPRRSSSLSWAQDLALYPDVARPPIAFTLGEPFEPQQQLLAVLPPHSRQLVPASLSPLSASAC